MAGWGSRNQLWRLFHVEQHRSLIDTLLIRLIRP